SIDVEDRAGHVDLIADVQDLHQLNDNQFDTILCSQVLEHVPRPWDAIAELTRVLRPKGRLLLTVPHLSMIHEAPHDYYRYTQFGLHSLCQRSGLEVEIIQPTGGLFCFLSHNASVVWMSSVGSLPGMMWPAWFLNYVFFVRLVGFFDRLCGLPSIYPCDYLVIARKPSPSEADQ
ncbi:MAG: class I SAM-dependent methyltransferase, partial [Planctomycetaceae bacterium]|nr:class I SAM-dependent methyltransferase [Planctomycetaceae bacterium]